MPETSVPAALNLASGAERTMEGSGNRFMRTTTTVSESEPLPMAMVLSSVKSLSASRLEFRWLLGGVSAHRGSAERAHGSDLPPVSKVAPMIGTVSPGLKTSDTGDLDIGCAGDEAERQGGRGRRPEIGTGSWCLAPVGQEAARAGIGWVGRCDSPVASGLAGERDVTSGLSGAGDTLVTLGCPGIDEAAVVKAVDNHAGSVT